MSTKRVRRTFDAAFKIEAVRRMEERVATQVPLSAIARDIGVRPEQLRSWAKRLACGAGQAPTDIFPGEGKGSSAEEEMRRLRREVEILRQERDFLKKTAAYFAKESR
jgi:transposase